jgi:hypothetical protein
VPPPVITTLPFALFVRDSTSFVPPSASVSLIKTSIAVAPSSSTTVFASSTASGESSTRVMSMKRPTAATLFSAAPSSTPTPTKRSKLSSGLSELLE